MKKNNVKKMVGPCKLSSCLNLSKLFSVVLINPFFRIIHAVREEKMAVSEGETSKIFLRIFK